MHLTVSSNFVDSKEAEEFISCSFVIYLKHLLRDTKKYFYLLLYMANKQFTKFIRLKIYDLHETP